MPVFRKGKFSLKQHEKMRRLLVEAQHEGKKFAEGIMVRREGKRRVYGSTGRWAVMGRGLKEIDHGLRINLEKLVHQISTSRTPRQPLIVVDWGCGDGRAISELAQKFKSQKNIQFIGYSRDYYSEFLHYQDHADFIHAPKEDLARYFHRKKIDIMFSHEALERLSISEFDQHLRELAPCFSPGGLLIVSTSYAQFVPQRYFEIIHKTERSIIFQRR